MIMGTSLLPTSLPIVKFERFKYFTAGSKINVSTMTTIDIPCKWVADPVGSGCPPIY